jgi:hypothetical protein
LIEGWRREIMPSQPLSQVSFDYVYSSKFLCNAGLPFFGEKTKDGTTKIEITT